MNNTAVQPNIVNAERKPDTAKPSTILHGSFYMLLALCRASFSSSTARISKLINRNISLLTTGLSFSSTTTRFTAMFRQGAVDKSIFVLLSAASVVVIAGLILCGVGGCMSLGNNRMKSRGIWFPIAGSLLAFGGLYGIYRAYLQLQASKGAKRAQVIFPSAFYLYIGVVGILFLVSLAILVSERRLKKEEKMAMPEKYSLFLMLLPIIILAFVFLYLPLYGWRYSFFNYEAGDTLSAKNFAGFKWFAILFRNAATVRDIVRVIRNTLVMSGLGILVSWVPMAFAILLNEIRVTLSNALFRQ